MNPSDSNKQALGAYIDHTLLKPTASRDDFLRLCDESLGCGFFSVCVPPPMIELCRGRLAGSQVKICTVIGFPTGGHTTLNKVHETRNACSLGADEIDMVIALWAIKSQCWNDVENDIREVVLAAEGRPVKVIFETHLLTDEEKRLAAQGAIAAGASFLKTSTGFSGGGATIEDVKLLHELAAGRCQVKASGGIRDLESMRNMIAAGAQRIGTSSGVSILKGLTSGESY